MKQLCTLFLLCWLGAHLAQAQDVVYLTDLTNAVGTLAEITPEKVTLRVAKGESTVRFSYGADKVIAVVNHRGRFLCMNQLLAQPASQRDQRIDQFMNGTDSPPCDIIIRAIPAEVIYGKVAYAQGDVVNYTTLDGAASSLPKSDLVGIFYQSGKHELIADATFLCDNPNLLADEPKRKKETPATPPAPAPKEDRTSEADKPVKTKTEPITPLQLTDAEYKDYRAQGLGLVQEFAVMLGVIADKTADAGQKDKAISQVIKMFRPDAVIQVSSMIRGGQPNTYKIKDYLIRLKLIPYKSVSLEWGDIQYVQELTQKDDGNYYGKIKGEQRFSGLNGKGEIQYSDITEKDVDVMLTPYKKQQEGRGERKWDVLLGNVGVVTTQ
ncbi:hypothetical protein [Spirosoma sp.]|uniref:hypothetical protein n=1 Tax=Spirosoma sp. TaxID=1899569 RepID=UPI00260B163E|nr:hypothetical protein [Spirosoma sp.]MCX6214603.1 hypothetical protein [Spirosoma sp.]